MLRVADPRPCSWRSRQVAGRIRQAGTTLIQPNQTSASLQRPNETAVVPGLLPLDIQTGDQARHHDQIGRTRAGNLIGDLRLA